ncbi:coiled-coil domain-containing protein 172 isoform X3 [Tachysurus vachellii]|uniref:coiled-coil domain-containing protein 172 isoform X3 n=1 Tax=Tachysurus vachellii TaxID=175792 RepID=UPI00296AB033|nr:coiled-coil domain-containing protein 172 isoform X3 [Tachysurus vachellii]
MSSDVNDVSLDSLYQQILLAEQQTSENTGKLHEVKSSIIKAEKEIKSFTEKLERAYTELDEKAQLESEILLQLKLNKRQQEEMEKKKKDLLEQQNGLREEMERIQREIAEEKEKFMNMIRTFNSDFNLLKNRDLVFHHQTKSEIQTLQSESEALSKEIERLKQEKTQLITLQTEQQSLSAELKGLHSQLTGENKILPKTRLLFESAVPTGERFDIVRVHRCGEGAGGGSGTHRVTEDRKGNSHSETSDRQHLPQTEERSRST